MASQTEETVSGESYENLNGVSVVVKLICGVKLKGWTTPGAEKLNLPGVAAGCEDGVAKRLGGLAVAVEPEPNIGVVVGAGEPKTPPTLADVADDDGVGGLSMKPVAGVLEPSNEGNVVVVPPADMVGALLGEKPDTVSVLGRFCGWNKLGVV